MHLNFLKRAILRQTLYNLWSNGSYIPNRACEILESKFPEVLPLRDAKKWHGRTKNDRISDQSAGEPFHALGCWGNWSFDVCASSPHRQHQRRSGKKIRTTNKKFQSDVWLSLYWYSIIMLNYATIAESHKEETRAMQANHLPFYCTICTVINHAYIDRTEFLFSSVKPSSLNCLCGCHTKLAV